MRKHLLLAVLIVINALLLIGCADNDITESPGEEIEKPKELFSIQNTENSDSISETEDATEDEDSYIDYNFSYERVNPMRKFLGELEEFPPPPVDVDVDFTTLGAFEFDDVFSDVMFMKTEEYLGKTLRIVGPYSNFNGGEDYGYFHFVLVDDGAGCCQRSVDLEWDEDNYPDEFPPLDSIVDIVGTFIAEDSVYVADDGVEMEYTYYYVLVKSMIILQEGGS